MQTFDDPNNYGDDPAMLAGGDDFMQAALCHSVGDGFRCLETFGDDLSLEDTPLIDMDDLLAN
jgi:hypothetical protein